MPAADRSHLLVVIGAGSASRPAPSSTCAATTRARIELRQGSRENREFREQMQRQVSEVREVESRLRAALEQRFGRHTARRTACTRRPTIDAPPSRCRSPSCLAEDFETYERSLLAPGFWAVAVHRVGERADRASGLQQLSLGRGAPPGLDGGRLGLGHPLAAHDAARPARAHLALRIAAAQCAFDRQRRAFPPRHHARSDAQSPTAHRPEALPIIEDNVEIGSGACVVGGVTVGRGAHVGANAVVLEAVPPGATVFGVPGGSSDERRDQTSARRSLRVRRLRHEPERHRLLDLLREDFATYERDPARARLLGGGVGIASATGA